MIVDKRFLVPLLGFMLLVAVLALGFKLRDPHLLPSQMLNRSLPAFSLPRLGDPSKTWSEKDLYGKVSLLNVWATWCPSCVQEDPQLMRISREEDISVFGINYNDDTAKALAWLQRYGNPFQLNIADHDGHHHITGLRQNSSRYMDIHNPKRITLLIICRG